MKKRNISKLLITIAVSFAGLLFFEQNQILAADSVKFKLMREYIIVIPVTVNGAGPYEFLLDTGTNTTLMSNEFARRIGLRPVDRVSLLTVSGTKIVLRSHLESIAVGSKSVANLEVLFSELREVRSVKSEICGVLGQNFLRRFNYLIDYRKQQIEIEDQDELENGLCGERQSIESHAGRTLISVKYPSADQSWRLVLDSGMPTLLLFAPAWQRLKIDWDQTGKTIVRLKSDVSSQLVEQRRLPGFKIGNERFDDLPVILIDSQRLDEGRIEDGLLPMSLFQKIYFNHRKGYAILNPKSIR